MTWPWIVAHVIQWVFIVAVGLLLLGLLRRVSEFLEGAESRLRGAGIPPSFGGLEPGSVVPGFELADSTGSVVRSAELLRSALLLLFMDPECDPCEDLARVMDASGEVEGVPLIVVTAASPHDPDLRLPDGIRVLHQDGKSVSQAFENIATPQAFALRGRMVIGRAIPQSMDDLRRLARLVAEGGEVSVLSRAAR